MPANGPSLNKVAPDPLKKAIYPSLLLISIKPFFN